MYDPYNILQVILFLFSVKPTLSIVVDKIVNPPFFLHGLKNLSRLISPPPKKKQTKEITE